MTSDPYQKHLIELESQLRGEIEELEAAREEFEAKAKLLHEKIVPLEEQIADLKFEYDITKAKAIEAELTICRRQDRLNGYVDALRRIEGAGE